MSVTIRYKSIVEKVALNTKLSINKTHRVIKELSYFLTKEIKKGNDIECLGLFTIKYTLTNEDIIYENKLVEFEEQVEVLSQTLDIQKDEVYIILTTYYRQIKLLLESGYQVNVKSIGYIEPQEKKGKITYFSRIAPVLVKNKAMYADFLVQKPNGEIVIKKYEQKELRFSMEVDQNLEIPYAVKKNHIKIN